MLPSAPNCPNPESPESKSVPWLPKPFHLHHTKALSPLGAGAEAHISTPPHHAQPKESCPSRATGENTHARQHTLLTRAAAGTIRFSTPGTTHSQVWHLHMTNHTCSGPPFSLPLEGHLHKTACTRLPTSTVPAHTAAAAAYKRLLQLRTCFDAFAWIRL